MQYQIYWTPQTQLFELQGATIDFRALNDVYYEHYFLPSGRVIATWRSNQHFQREKKVSDLPQLLRGVTYTIERSIDNSERMFAYLVVTFYDEQYQKLVTNSQNADKITVTVPENYAFYTIDLVSAGNGHFVFHDFVIRQQKKGVLRDNDLTVAPKLYAYLQAPEKITTKTLRVVFSEPEKMMTDYMTDWINETQQAVQYLTSSDIDAGFYRNHELDLIATVKDARKQVHANKIEFVGYGPISSYAALYYQQQIKGSLAIISEDVILLPSSELKIVRTVDNVQYLGNPIVANHQVALVIPHPRYERLSMLSYETPTPKELRRQQAYDAAHPKKSTLSKFFTKNKNNTQ
ncbi:accessory Sec system protein Asp3 [Leuconostoc gasicomitatum]|uniref:accessory Sec system protein Asp3 n=1 Tax=Leuconostoc gasicomitatum TaxID=115778 RepID=UPI001CC60117|nr:accessory Sec system protein Asp3 [Leuconostoc gasicomitatum]MBZ5970659.1 accessory Sec system protein Asp3 [Leuconostoc gasicomitatum]MBZ5997678.1 accessory Sec system protein Asp3 [Leuconostoc gasicomitatum]